jgi:hypothetical protein
MSDKRSVTTDALQTLGTIITEGERDAIHLAVEPIIAAERLLPGQHIGIVDGKASKKATKLLGIVDPFIEDIVMPGEKFWLIVYPRQITSLRHVWSHPDFEERNKENKKEIISESETWLRNFCETHDCPKYEVVIAASVGDYVDNSDYGGSAYVYEDDYLLFRGRDAHSSIPPEFWDHVEKVTGKKCVSRVSHFSCSC